MELLRINYESEQPTVSARELHEGLEINTKFATWFERMCEYGFSEGNEFFPKVGKTSEQGGRPSIDYQISIDMAKQICMIQRTDKGKQYRQYFIDLEKAWNTPEQVMARALKIANNEIDKLKAENKVLIADTERMKPKEIFADAVESSRTSILIGDMAKLICQNGHEIGQNRLFEWMRQNDYLIKSGGSKNMPTQKAMEQKLFEVKERTVVNPDGSVRITRTTLVTGKGQIHFINKFARMKAEMIAEIT
ncbi:MAG: phage antirepressor KilAC domain-containing protein [Lachnospiraceae bacterium]|jgi:anti-repressor protein|nr:phage antirepressor KilAC domain-containing protein [Lachnospiraceae bacterium]